MALLTRIFLGYMALIGAVVGAVLVVKPEVRDFRLPPYFWILIAMLLFELAVFLRTRRTPGETIAMEVRFSAWCWVSCLWWSSRSLPVPPDDCSEVASFV
jgi:hypothetical protein